MHKRNVIEIVFHAKPSVITPHLSYFTKPLLYRKRGLGAGESLSSKD